MDKTAATVLLLVIMGSFIGSHGNTRFWWLQLGQPNNQVAVSGWGPWSGFGFCCNGVQRRIRYCRIPSYLGSAGCDGPTWEEFVACPDGATDTCATLVSGK
ncbi:uncharacterized protein LOC106165209 isoform X1 [Lingula anatina]|uniref:Uncharacterized protein LOC106165209 isoform X1 n=1 Tax=Lingula anatina TaxID=7574 RepID=A0A1S3IML3_LINAN|nr:uncharacterized protein LOC106165209 isoform X1 [Lingula anatina]|eukprot:XP_013398774.1 uncharacterized protein LOC106165209 isoform X1 [Lingula anatina]